MTLVRWLPLPPVGRARVRQRGFTLTELMAVVLITGILAVIGTSTFRQHILASRSAETTAMIRSIAAAQERFRGENMTYLNVSSTLTTYYPSADVGALKRTWAQQQHQDLAAWRLLNPTVVGPVQFGYACIAGPPGVNAFPGDLQVDPGWPADQQFQSPWYVIQAAGDPDENGVLGYFVSASFNSQIIQTGDVP